MVLNIRALVTMGRKGAALFRDPSALLALLHRPIYYWSVC